MTSELGPEMSGESNVNKRAGKRYRFAADASLRQLDTGLTLQGVLLDLSTRGCLLRLAEAPAIEIGTSIDLSVKSNAVFFRAVGSVRRCSRELRLLGVSFVNLNQRGHADLRELIDELESTQQPKRSPK